jgi:hypothetical protein
LEVRDWFLITKLMLTSKWRSNVLLLSWLFLSLFPLTNFASHLIAVEIRAKPLNCNTRTYEVTVIGYINYESAVRFGGDQDTLFFGDGKTMLVQEIMHTVIDPVLHIGKVEFKVSHTYGASGTYVLSYKEYSRNEGIINMDASGFTTFYTETSISIASGSCDSSPYLTVPPIDRACTGGAYYHNPGAVDSDDDSLSYSFVVPQSGLETDVKNYLYPINSKFYTAAGLNYNRANETKDGPPAFLMDPSDGTVTWNAPGAHGEYALAIKVTSWKFNAIDSTWFKSGYIIRDMQVFVEDCSNKKPELDIPADFCVTAGTLIQFTSRASDPDNDPVIIEAFSDVFSLDESPAEIIPNGGPLQSTKAPYDTAAVQFKWRTDCSHVKALPYKIIFKITDGPPAGPRLVRFKTVSIKIVAPPPEFESVTVNPLTKKVTLHWKNYACEEIQGIQLWRRVAEYQYEQPECNSGMPYFLRYKLLATLPAGAKNYTDGNLSLGAQYCYRIVALMGDDRIPSRISLDTCLIPQPAKAPVITNVSVVKSESNGSMLVRWTSPFDIDKIQYPPPYTYKLYRAAGFVNNGTFVEVNSIAIQDTVYTDTQVDTQNSPYQYKIELYVPGLTDAPVDTSSNASSVYLKAQPLPGKIKLSWEFSTPWYNFIQAYPNHLIYRSEQPTGPFILIDSVDVNEYGLQYIDSGKFQNRKLIEEQNYYYKVLTRGSYGNPAIVEPLENFSQIAGSPTLDVGPPCIPIVVIQTTDCKLLNCSTDTYFNKITWSFPDNTCLEEGLTYRVFVSDSESDEFLPLSTTSEINFEHTNLSSMAKCYSVAAIDAAGNISALSTSVCNDNCPYFELPNVFTPALIDGANDQFIAFGSETGLARCARFVKSVDLKIYNRWGEEVYSISEATPGTIYSFWDGSTNSGSEIESGIYFYSARVTFDVRDPSQQDKVIKGWVHLMR